jgi:hypothetical protein
MRVFVEPETNRVLWLHVRVLRVLDQGERRLKLVATHPALLNDIAGRDRLRDPKL